MTLVARDKPGTENRRTEMNTHTWRIITLASVLGVVLAGPSPAPAQGPGAVQVPPGVRLPGSPVERVLKPALSCSVFFATDAKGTNKISKPTVVIATESLKKIYLFYSFKNAGKGKAVNVPVEAVVGGSVTVPLGTPQTASLANAYCPKESCKFPGKVTVNPGASLPAVMAASFTILSPSDVLSRPLFQYTSYAYVVLHAQGRLPADNKPCTPAENFTVHYKK